MLDLAYLEYLARRGASDVHPMGRVGTAHLMALLRVRDGMRILEIGCGTGRTLVRLASSANIQIIGVDVLPTMLRAAARRIRWSGVQSRASVMLVAQGSPLPFDDATFDVVIAESVLAIQSVGEMRALLSEIARVLKTGGRYLGNESIWKTGTTQEEIDAINRSCVDDFGVPQSTPSSMDLAAWRAMMESCGLHHVSTVPVKPAPDMARAASPARVRIADLIIAWARIPALFSPRMRALRTTYAAALRRHAHDGERTESFLWEWRR